MRDATRLAARVMVGGYLAAHGAQKLFGSFGGYGIEGTGKFFEGLGLRPGPRGSGQSIEDTRELGLTLRAASRRLERL